MEDITSLIVNTIHDKLPNLPVYRENMPTAFSEPSFAVNRIGVHSSGELHGYDMRTYAFDLSYFPTPERPREDADMMAEWLMENLKIVEPNYATLLNRDINVTDNILHYTFDIRAHVRGEPAPTMNQNLDYKGGLKNG
mgnify:CR=1 FL=1